MEKAIIGRKIGMSQIFDEADKATGSGYTNAICQRSFGICLTLPVRRVPAVLTA